MRYYQFKPTLLEGGNIFKSPASTKENPQMLTDRINKAEVGPTVEFLESITGLDLADNLLGSTGIAQSSGDIDVAVDSNTISKDELIDRLQEQGVEPGHIKKSGDSVHYMSPIWQEGGEKTNRFVQVDFMFTPNVEMSKWSMRTAPDSSYKGMYLQKLRNDLANVASPKDESGKSTWKWVPLIGLLQRSDNKPPFGYDPDNIARGLLGKGADRSELESVERVLDALKKYRSDIDQQVRDAYKATLAPKKPDEKPDPNAPKLDEGKDDDRATEALSLMKQRNIASAYAKVKLIRNPRFRNYILRELGKMVEEYRLQKSIDDYYKQKATTNESKIGQAVRAHGGQGSKVGREFQHIEDLVYIEGLPGVKRALHRLAQISQNTKPLEVKWDGSPAIVFGRDESGKFHFGDKYAKQMLSTPEEVYAYYTRTGETESRKQFAREMAELCTVYENATPPDFRGFLEAGLMYKTTPPLNKQGEYHFMPNTVEYFVKKDSELGQRIAGSISGAAATGLFDGLPATGGRRRPVGDSYKQFNGTDAVVIIPPKFTESGTNVDVDKLRLIGKYAASNGQQIEQFLAPEPGLTDIRSIIYSYVNSQVDDPQNLDKLGHNFAGWVDSNPKLSPAKKLKLTQRMTDNARGASAVFKLTQAIMHIKDAIIGNKEKETLGSMGIRAQLKTGEHGGEGFVHDPEGGVGPTKLVNRGGFTRANRIRESKEQGRSAVVGWGRGMGHKGHMLLAKAVIEYAKATGGTPFFFVSETVGKDDPLTPREKLAIYQRVFPQHKGIFKTEKSVLKVAQSMYDNGFTQMTLVVGEDQKQSFGFLSKNPSPDKIPVTVLSRQDVAEKLNMPVLAVDGPRATPLRNILLDPQATTKQKFKLWRRDMPKALTDEQVMAIMKLAAARMSVPIEDQLQEADQPPQSSIYSPLSATTRDRPAPDPKAAMRRRREAARMRKFMGHRN